MESFVGGYEAIRLFVANGPWSVNLADGQQHLLFSLRPSERDRSEIRAWSKLIQSEKKLKRLDANANSTFYSIGSFFSRVLGTTKANSIVCILL